MAIDFELALQGIDGRVGIHHQAIAHARGAPNRFVTVSGDPDRRRRFLQRTRRCLEVAEFIVLAGEITPFLSPRDF